MTLKYKVADTGNGKCAEQIRGGPRQIVLVPGTFLLVVSVSQSVGGILCPGPLRGFRLVTIHLCGLPVAAAAPPEGITLADELPEPLLDLAPGGGYQAAEIAPDAGALLPHRFTLACSQQPPKE
ncbi:hypothetical protein IMCC26207_102156 [Actinobacteria bacterium IMCC26207]|nr:hypothetical protein IMCC26207_102156 [Actinobacteria bacterium IMCC26207]